MIDDSEVALLLTLLPPQQRRDRDDADHDRRVRDVEGPEADVADAHVDEIDDITLADTIQQIAEGATELHPERRRHEPGAARDLTVVIDDREHSEDREHREERGALGQKAECRAGVLRVHDSDVVTEDGAGRTQGDVLAHPRFGEAIEDEDGGSHARDDEDPRGSHA